MRYEHLVQINDLERPDLPLLERQQLWSGLLARAERPALFDDSVDAAHSLSREADRLELEIVRGSSTTRATAILRAGAAIEIGVGAGSVFAGSALTIAIEEPAPRALFLRFTYELRGPGVPVDEAELGALRQAYYYADLELVRRIRALVPGAAGTVAAWRDGELHPSRAGLGGAR